MASTTPSPTSSPISSFTSFVTPPPASTAPTSSSSPVGVGNTGPTIASSASLYLYTFLATLVLLLGVSSAIVVRSLLLRRRHRRMVEEAIRNGTWVPPAPPPTRTRFDPSKKPKMFEAWTLKPDDGTASRRSTYSEKMALKDERDWDGIMPFSATYTTPLSPPTLPSPEGTTPNSTTTTNDNDTSTTNGNGSTRLGSIMPWRRPRAPPIPAPIALTPTSPTQNLTQNQNTPSPPSTLRVAVLIAMPSPPQSPHPHNNNNTHDLEELPHLEFGVAEVPVSEAAQGKRSSVFSEGGASASGEGGSR